MIRQDPRTSFSRAEAAALAAVDESWLLDVLAGLVAIPSWQGRERAAQEYMAAAMDGLGMGLDVWEIDEAEVSGPPRLRHRNRQGRSAGGGGAG